MVLWWVVSFWYTIASIMSFLYGMFFEHPGQRFGGERIMKRIHEAESISWEFLFKSTMVILKLNSACSCHSVFMTSFGGYIIIFVFYVYQGKSECWMWFVVYQKSRLAIYIIFSFSSSFSWTKTPYKIKTQTKSTRHYCPDIQMCVMIGSLFVFFFGRVLHVAQEMVTLTNTLDFTTH